MLKLFISLPKKEFLEIIYAINKFIHYINGYEFFVRIDDSSITYLMNKPNSKRKDNKMASIITGI